MSDSFLKWGNVKKNGGRSVVREQQNNSKKIIFTALMLIVFVSIIQVFFSQPTSYAIAYTGVEAINSGNLKSPLLEQKTKLFEKEKAKIVKKTEISAIEKKVVVEESLDSKELAAVIYDIVGETPLKEMVPHIARYRSDVAAFLVGIAKKESSFGLASPSKGGTTCYNYWGYKGSGSRGTSLGYSCFGSAQEAVEIVGKRIEVLVNKDRNTPVKMVDTWKCGKSCAGDPGAPGWVSTVALYFNKIVKNEG